MDDLLADFLTETNESLGELDTALVKLEANPEDRETLGLIFRLVHTVKGTCGFLGLPRLEKVAHAAENVLGRLRDNQLQVAPEIITPILAAIDRVKDIVAGLAATGTEPAADDAPLIAVAQRDRQRRDRGRSRARRRARAGRRPGRRRARPAPCVTGRDRPAAARARACDRARRCAARGEGRRSRTVRGAGRRPDHPRRRRGARGPDDPGLASSCSPATSSCSSRAASRTPPSPPRCSGCRTSRPTCRKA